jgi:hypothetical protein
MSDSAFNFNEFIKESKDSLMNPRHILPHENRRGLGEPIIKVSFMVQ